MNHHILTQSAQETKALGFLFAQEILKEKTRKNALLVGLKGNLGSGKTTFVQGVAQGLGIRGSVQSPTFVLMKRYAIRRKRFTKLYHIDWYRISAKEVKALGMDEILSNPSALVLVEWPGKGGSAFLKHALTISFRVTGPHTRKITISSL